MYTNNWLPIHKIQRLEHALPYEGLGLGAGEQVHNALRHDDRANARLYCAIVFEHSHADIQVARRHLVLCWSSSSQAAVVV